MNQDFIIKSQDFRGNVLRMDDFKEIEKGIHRSCRKTRRVIPEQVKNCESCIYC